MARAREPKKVLVEPASTFSVRIEEKPPEPFQWQDLLRIFRNRWVWILTGFFSLILVILVNFLTPTWIVLDCGSEIALNLEYPRWLSTGDEGMLRLTIQNETSDSLTGIVALQFWGPLPVHLGEGQTTRLEVQGLPARASASHSVAFRIHSPPLFFRSGTLRFSVQWITAKGPTLCRTSEGTEIFWISLAPIHGLQGLYGWLRSGPLSLIVLAFWEWAKKRILKE